MSWRQRDAGDRYQARRSAHSRRARPASGAFFFSQPVDLFVGDYSAARRKRTETIDRCRFPGAAGDRYRRLRQRLSNQAGNHPPGRRTAAARELLGGKQNIVFDFERGAHEENLKKVMH